MNPAIPKIIGVAVVIILILLAGGAFKSSRDKKKLTAMEEKAVLCQSEADKAAELAIQKLNEVQTMHNTVSKQLSDCNINQAGFKKQLEDLQRSSQLSINESATRIANLTQQIQELTTKVAAAETRAVNFEQQADQLESQIASIRDAAQDQMDLAQQRMIAANEQKAQANQLLFEAQTKWKEAELARKEAADALLVAQNQANRLAEVLIELESARSIIITLQNAVNWHQAQLMPNFDKDMCYLSTNKTSCPQGYTAKALGRILVHDANIAYSPFKFNETTPGWGWHWSEVAICCGKRGLPKETMGAYGLCKPDKNTINVLGGLIHYDGDYGRQPFAPGGRLHEGWQWNHPYVCRVADDPDCMLAADCPTGWTDKGLSGLQLLKSEYTANPFAGGGDWNEHWKWAHPRICCKR